MKLENFEIGGMFETATGLWVCDDIGTRSIIARKYDGSSKQWDEFDHEVFYPYDWPGCQQVSKLAYFHPSQK